jgi:hypothetical protein
MAIVAPLPNCSVLRKESASKNISWHFKSHISLCWGLYKIILKTTNSLYSGLNI